MQKEIIDKSIAVVIPTIRPEKIKQFLKDWNFKCQVFIIYDGKKPILKTWDGKKFSAKQLMGKYSALIGNRTSAVRNMGFAYIAKYCPEVEYIITTDDDVSPIGDPIQDHIDVLNTRVPVSWMSLGSEYTRGFPYGVRDEAEVVLSHGVWENVHDYDAPTQLVRGNPKMKFFKGPIPKGIFYPMSIMNVGFKRKMLPYMYMMPPFMGVDRADDVFGGQYSKKVIDKKGWAVVTGYSNVWHDKASNVFTNLVKEARGFGLNELYWQNKTSPDVKKYFKEFHKRMRLWKEFVENCSIHDGKK